MTPLQLAGLFGWILNHPELGWIVALAYLFFEIRTRWGKIYELFELIKNVITVVRALARVHGDIDTTGVDEYLLENGMEPGDFITDEEEDPPEQLLRGGDD